MWTVGEWVEYWYITYKEPKHALTTRQVQWTYINCHIKPLIGDMLLNQVKTYHIQNMINYLQKEGNRTKLKHSNGYGKPLAAWTVKKIRAMLLAAFDVAVREKLIEKNPVRETEPITVQTLQVAYFTPKQQELFLEKTRKHRFHVAYQLLFYTGCRRSEILGLTWDCVDFENNQIHIRNVLIVINGNPVPKNYPKTKASVRTIPVHPSLMRMLKDHLLKQKIESKNPSYDNKHNLVFCNKDGSPHSPTYFLHNFKATIRRLGLPTKLRVHSTRHTFATNLLKLPGVSIADVQQLGGWSDTRVVLDIYAHTVKESQRNAVKKLFESNQPKQKKSSKGKR